MSGIKEIMNMLDWNNVIDIQEEGRKLAKESLCIKELLQPVEREINKNVWDNCAIILSEKSDLELTPYLIELMEWLQDMNWPGAFCILERLKKYSDRDLLGCAYNTCINRARQSKDAIWESNLQMLT